MMNGRIAMARVEASHQARRATAQVFASVFDAIADTPQEAANMRARAELMRQIGKFIERKRWTQSVAAQECGVSQPRMNDLLRGRISLFSLDALVNIASHIGTVQVQLRRAALI